MSQEAPVRYARLSGLALSLVLSATFGLLWALLQAAGSSVLATIFLALYLIATTVLFAGIPWSKFSHMFFKPAAAFEKRSYSVAIKNLDEAVKYVKRNDSAYYHLGLSYWQLNKMDAAMLNFAKAYILKGATSNNAKQYLEQLWKSSHRNSLAV